ncbi:MULTISPECIES: hypothetical protein [Larsenimonas]|uniref:Uncharacterized protein n=1 Tax=Larsenimonas suaedae TaxID=1851019 RepID=A0ABU1GV73_9GAMM|nr:MULTISPECIES: hypothetical protein [Larsenimonas]MCM2971222.1 hypothetical protein [Larsenimonas suaedae]MCM5703330.1 hypothetical protein [Larsenimonas salina]MDR5895931.1 hypothetical protein [Larsenimonas suaedae]
MVALIWIVVCGLVAFFANKAWDGSFGQFVQKWVPDALHVDDYDRYVWSGVAGVLVATFIVKPISMFLTLILLALIGFAAKAVMGWAVKKIH